jgi:hypothetical protein
MLVAGNTCNVVRGVDDLSGHILILRALFNDVMVVIAEAPPPRFLRCVNEIIQAPWWVLGSDNIIKLILYPIRLCQRIGYLDEPPGVVMRKSFADFIGRALAPLRNFAFTGRAFGWQLERLIRPCP